MASENVGLPALIHSTYCQQASPSSKWYPIYSSAAHWRCLYGRSKHVHLNNSFQVLITLAGALSLSLSLTLTLPHLHYNQSFQ